MDWGKAKKLRETMDRLGKVSGRRLSELERHSRKIRKARRRELRKKFGE